MAIRIQCPSPECRAMYSINESINGRRVRCPKCGTSYRATPTLDGRSVDTGQGRPMAEEPFPQLPAEFGRYRVLRLLGRGGMGSVYIAHDTELDREVAIKLPFFGPGDTSPVAERFIREARAAAALHHPNICTVFDVGQINGRAFLTMALIDGKPLETLIDPDQPQPQDRAAEIVRDIALALDHAHQRGIIHRDLKPSNIVMRTDGVPIVMDFGLAKRTTESDAGEAKLTREGGVIGTPRYMSPEQLRGKSTDVGPAADVYSLGVILFELLAGRPPYSGSLIAIMGQILAAPVPQLQEFRADADERLAEICQQAMAKNLNERIPTMAAMAQALDDYLTKPGNEASNHIMSEALVPVDTARIQARPLRNRVFAAWISAAAGIVAIGMFAILNTGKSEKKPPVNPLNDAEKWVSLFNGKDLNGWVIESGEENAWSVQDGVLTSNAGEENDRSLMNQGYLLSEREYTDLILRFQFQQPSSKFDWGGVALRAVPHETKRSVEPSENPGRDFPLHMTIVVGHRDPNGPVFSFPTGSLWWNATGAPCRLPINATVLKDMGEWNDVEITMKGQSLKMVCNGTVVQDMMLNSDLPPKPFLALGRFSGRIGFMKRAGQIRYRQIEVNELSPSKLANDPSIKPIPFVVAKWQHHVARYSQAPMTLYSNGRINSPNSQNYWMQYGNQLVLRWPNPAAARHGGYWVDTCTISNDGAKYNGKNQDNSPVWGIRLPD